MNIKKSVYTLPLLIFSCFTAKGLEEIVPSRSENIFEFGQSKISLTISKERFSIEKAKEEIRTAKGEETLSSVVFPSETFVRETYIIQEVDGETGKNRLWSTIYDRADVEKDSPWYSLIAEQVAFEIIEKYHEKDYLFLFCIKDSNFVLLVLKEQEDEWFHQAEVPIYNYAVGALRPVRVYLTKDEEGTLNMNAWIFALRETEKAWRICLKDGFWTVAPIENPKEFRPPDFEETSR